MKYACFAILLAGCATSPHLSRSDRANAAKVAAVTLAGESFETGRPVTSKITRLLARGDLTACSVAMAFTMMPPSLVLSNAGVADAIEGALTPNVRWQKKVAILDAAYLLIPDPK